MSNMIFPSALRIQPAAGAALGSKSVGELQGALTRLKLAVPVSEQARKELGAATSAAVSEFQRRAGLPANGEVTTETVARMNAEIEHNFIAANKVRTRRLQEMLIRVGITVDPEEVRARRFGDGTAQALRKYQERVGLPQDARVSAGLTQRLGEDALMAQLGSKTQVAQMHQTLLRALSIAKLSEVRVAADELKGRKIGSSTAAAIKAVQEKYGLPATGVLDTATNARLVSLAASTPRPTRILKAKAGAELRPIASGARLNMTGTQVGEIQSALAYLGYRVNASEFTAKKFGGSTREAVLAYQRQRGLPPSGHVTGATLRSLNNEVRAANPDASAREFPYRIRGSVRNELWEGLAGVRVEIAEKLIAGQGTVLAERPTGANGFFDIPYDPPRDPVTNQVKQPFHLQITARAADNSVIGTTLLFNPTLIAWANFTQGDQPYRGMSEFDQRFAAVAKAVQPAAVATLVEKPDQRQISLAAQTAGLATDDVMRLVLAHLVATELADARVGAAACYAYIRQNLPPNLPSDLIGSTVDWTLIAQLLEQTASGLVFMDDALLALAFDNAVTMNLMPIAVGLKKDIICGALAEIRHKYVLEKPILVGNASIQSLLAATTAGTAHSAAVGSAFLQHRGFGTEFWVDVNARPNDFGGAAALVDLRNTVEIGHVTKNFVPMLTAVKQKIADPSFTLLKSSRDLAKLTETQWVDLITANGSQVPPSTDGQTPADKVQTYAATLMNQSEGMFPAIALAATVARSTRNPLPNIGTVQKFLDDNPDFNLRTDNVDAYLKDSGIALDDATLTQTRVMQRVHRIAPRAAVGQALLDNRIHNSSQIVAMGKEHFASLLTGGSQVDRRTALTVFGMAEFQYAQVLQRIGEYRFDLHRSDPQAIVDLTYTQEELAAAFAGIPDLATLFGSLDYCSCMECQSVYGPAAYLADVLRFLDSHPSEVANESVRDILFRRRPDIGNIKLNCENTQTPLPYIDLVCEVLESAIGAPAPTPDFSFQTTRTAAELRAFPEHTRDAAYDTLRDADYPMYAPFDLRQEEARVFLKHLGVPRWELMETFQARPAAGPNLPRDSSIAGEYFGMSTRETAMITAVNEAVAARQMAYWGFKTAAIPTELTVADFLRRTRLDYSQLIDLLSVRWLNPPDAPNPMVIERPDATCDTEKQKVVGLTVERLDAMHRFLRLWRHTPWAMWELDLLIRAPRLGNALLNEDTLVTLKRFAHLQKRVGLPADAALSLFGDINTESRVKADEPHRAIPPLYTDLFLNPVVTSPVDAAFNLPIAAGALLSQHRSTLLGALALTEADLSLLLVRGGTDALTVASVSQLSRYALLSRGLSLRVKDLLTLERLWGVSDLFASVQVTTDLIDAVDWVRKSGYEADELAYLLEPSPTSPLGLRDEVIAQYVDALREALRSNEVGQPDGTIIAQLATPFGLATDQSDALLRNLEQGGVTLLARLNDASLMARDATGNFTTPITAANFPAIFDVYRLMHKASSVVTRLKIKTQDLLWLLENFAAFALLEIGALPTAAAAPATLFPAWLTLVKWVWFQQQFPQPETTSLRQIFSQAGNAATAVGVIKLDIVALTQWKAGALDEVTAALGFQHGAASDYAKIDTYLRLQKSFTQLARLADTTASVLLWVDRDRTAADAQKNAAQQIRQLAKSKYDNTTWLAKVTPMQDEIRERKRDALIGYLVETSLRTVEPEIVQGTKRYANPAYWRDGNDLLNYFLIDVEMCSCQLTSRIKQAISSTQMFVQRCLLGLEQPDVQVSRAAQQDTVSENSWRQWTYMKSLVLWAANRKVFLYPENWIEPELRADKSPFFEELEAELLQKDITDESAEAAFLHYVQKVHEVSRLEIVSAYYELDDTNPYDDLPPDINRLHVIGRTHAHPAVYYYRAFDLNYGEWSAWEKIDLDIQSDQLCLVVYNRRLHLFWLEFVEKPQKVKKQPTAQPTSGPTDVPETPNQLEIQLNWSARQDTGWTSRRVSRQKLVHPWQRPLFSYSLKPRYKPLENQLWMDLYISQSHQFNNTKFWDAYTNSPKFVTASRFDETARPWHSSSFVFDGEVVNLKMKGLSGQYRILDNSGLATDNLSNTNSHTYVRDSFGATGRAVGRLTGGYEIGPRLPLPDGMHYENSRLVNNKRTLNGTRANVLENGQTRTLLAGARSPFEVVHSHHAILFDTAAFGPVPFFYQDGARAMFIRPEWQQIVVGYNQPLPSYFYNFFPFYHPYTALFMRELNRSGLDGLLNRRIQTTPQNYYPGNGFTFGSYAPGSMSRADQTMTRDTVDFERYGAYALYNWEIFFHAPFLIACRLTQNQRFAEAMRWFHYIFDPTNTESEDIPQRYWITRKFYEQNSEDYRKQRIEVLLRNIADHTEELRAWKNNPFKPHLIARYRPVAYQKAVVMKYIDNLIAWADQLFRRDTIEAINEATTLYVLAYELLGRRPVKVPNVEHAELSYNELMADGGLDPFGNKRVDIVMENFTGMPVRVTRTDSGTEPLPQLDVFYFSIPNNDELLAYWDTVEDRLFKIRHCRNIEGVERQLPLFDPPIDPALLVKAVAAGVDLGSVLADVSAAAGPYRFPRAIQRAIELCAEVRSLGDKLLAALERYDGEGLALLRGTQEIQLQKAVRALKKQALDEAEQAQVVLEKSKAIAEQKKTYYESRDFMNAGEIVAISLGGVSALAQTAIAVGYSLAGGLALIPRFTTGAAGFGGSPEVTADPADGARFAKAAENAVATLGAIASAADKLGAVASTVAGYQRRQDDWTFQAEQAAAEIAQLDAQIVGAQMRAALAQYDLDNQDMQVEQSQAVDEYMHSKYTNQELCDWQVRQIAALYFQSYQLAYDVARQAEKAFQFEVGDPSARFVQFGYWDSLKKGLLAGERLASDLRRLESAYAETNTRELEITKNISLGQFLPLSLMALKEAGACTVLLPEWLFDMDFPGHYRRRLKTVALSIPCVAGPYTSVNCTLSLTNHAIRMNTSVAGGYGDPLAGGDTRFYKSPAPVTAIATSHGQNDSGMFELSFNDERFLPFEGAGAVSEWRLELRQDCNQFDLATVSDVILHVRYMAVASGDANLIDAAKAHLAAILPTAGTRLIVINQEFGSQWHRFLNPGDGAPQVLNFTLGREHLPFYARNKTTLALTSLDLVAEGTETAGFTVKLTPSGAAQASDEAMLPDPVFGGRQHLAKSGFAPTAALLGDWKLQIRRDADADFNSLPATAIRNAYFVIGFKAS